MDTIDSFVPVLSYMVTHYWNNEVNEAVFTSKAAAIDYATRHHGTWEQLYRKLPKDEPCIAENKLLEASQCTAPKSDVTTVLNESTGIEAIEPVSAAEILQLEAESSQSCQCTNPTTCQSSTPSC